MKSFSKYQDIFLIIITLALLGVLVGYYVWGITGVATTINKGINPPIENSEEVSFHIDQAQKLDLHGLVR